MTLRKARLTAPGADLRPTEVFLYLPYVRASHDAPLGRRGA